jgi:hypothetical protein
MTEDFDPLDHSQAEEDRDKADAAKALSAQQQEADFLWLMRDKRGRRIVWRQLAEAGVFQQNFNPDAMTMAFKEGRRNAGLTLLAQVHALCPDLYTTMMKEQLK